MTTTAPAVMAAPGVSRDRLVARAVAASLVGTLGLGLWMRLSMLGLLPVGLDFAHLRHAHSHLGAYGVLFPLAFLAWQRRGAFTLPGAAMLAYGVATALSVVGFLTRGYGGLSMVGSTVVAAIWAWAAWGLRARLRRPHDPLALVPLSIVAALACIPFIAFTLRKDPAFAHQLVTTFLGALLLLVVTPSALSAIGVRVWWSPAVWLCGVLGVASLGLWENVLSRAGLVVYASALGLSVWRAPVRPVLRLAWTLLGAGLLAMALGLVPNLRPSVLGAIHFLVLAPVLLSLGPLAFMAGSARAEAVLLAAVVLVAAPLVVQAFGLFGGTLALTSAGSVVVAGWWTVAALRPQ